MRIVNKDLTRESVNIFITNNQIYAEIYHKSHGKWKTSTYFQSYDWNVDVELINSTVRYIKRTWDLSDPKVVVEF